MSETARHTFRIVMLTDDVQIDRRILLQAKTLIAQGAEVILLAQGGEGLKDYEIMPGGIKLRRYYAPDNPPALAGQALSIQQRLVNRLNRRSIRLQEDLNSRYGWLESRIAALSTNRRFAKAFIWLLLERLLLIWNRISVKITVQKPAVYSLKIAQILAKYSVKLTGPPSLDEHLAKMVEYYRPDIVQAHDLPQLPAAVLVKQRTGARVIYDAHELYPEIGSLTKQQKRIASHRERRFAPHADVITTINPYISKEMMRRYRISEPDIIFNATERPEGFSTGRHDNLLRKATGLGPECKILLFQGWVHEMRGICDLVRSLSNVHEHVHLVLLGYGQMDLMRSTAQDAGVSDRLHILPAVPWDELLHWTASADAGVIPYQKSDLNNYLCSPNKLFEFILAGLPIIASDFPFLKDVVRGNEFGVTEDLESTDGFSRAINLMFEPENDRSEKFRQNIIREADKWSWQAMEPILLDVFSRAGARFRPSVLEKDVHLK